MISYIGMPKSWQKLITHVVVGVDEAGRGPLAGPVSVGIVVSSPKGVLQIIKSSPIELRDSKKLTKKGREIWYDHIEKCKEQGFCDYAVAMTPAIYIDKHGITKAAQRCVDTAFKKLNLNPKVKVLLDAGLRPPKGYENYIVMEKGDEREAVIALASIMAKVTRDRYMEKMSKKFPEYAFERNMGYGTKRHLKALEKNGETILHRKTFLKYLLR